MSGRMWMVVLLALWVTLLCGCGGAENDSGTTPPAQSDPRLEYWQARFPSQKAITWKEVDLNSDNRPDAVVIYQDGEEKCAMCGIIDTVEGYQLTNQLPAPVSDQQIEVKDIDQKPPLEFIVSGSKGANVGFAVYRLENGQLVDLFGQNMNLCC